jgi:N6-L-threonylcarbamoyladenine synthase/protein kinase Bud32
MISLGIESTAHTFGVGIISDKGQILANKRVFYKPPFGMGIRPREAAQYHIENGPKILKRALKESKIKIQDINLVSFSKGPGLPNCLQIGGSFARYLSQKYKKPLVGVNHCIAHIEIGKLMTKCKDPVIVYCSGGNTQIIAYAGGKYRIFGETEDIPAGNAFDILGRYLGLKMPGGPEIEILAKNGKWIDLPYVVKGMDLSFTGIVTECRRKYRTGAQKQDICYSFQEVIYAMLVEVTERALAHTNKKQVLITGGVAASRRLKQMMNKMCREREAKCYVVPYKLAGDNGLMIAWCGLLAYKRGQNIENSGVIRDWRTDEVNVNWV